MVLIIQNCTQENIWISFCVISNPKLSCENLRSMMQNLCLVSSGIFVLVKQKILRTTLPTTFYFVAKSTLHQAGIVSMQRMFTWKSQSHNSQPASDYTDCCVRWPVISCSLMILFGYSIACGMQLSLCVTQKCTM